MSSTHWHQQLQSRLSEAANRKSVFASLPEFEAKAFLHEYGISSPNRIFIPVDEIDGCESPLESKLQTLSPPFAAKIVSDDILHKSDAGGVALNLSDAAQTREAMSLMLAKPAIADVSVAGFLIEEMAAPGVELVVGAIRDPNFGFLLMVGLGGVFVEIMRDVVFRICPVVRSDVEQMLHELKGAPLLDGARGQTPVDREALIELILALGGRGGLLDNYGDLIAEVDINPIIARGSTLTAVDARILLGEPDDQAALSQPSPDTDFRPLFAPRSIAVVGASSSGVTMANTFIRRQQSFDFPGNLYVLHPNAESIEGIACHQNFESLPEDIDYAYICVGAQRVPGVLRDTAGRVKIAQVVSSGFGEVAEGVALQSELRESARKGGCRVIGPNCLGTYSPRGGLTFPDDAPKETGHVGVLAQSGGLSTDIIKRGQARGIRFSGVVTIGNCADVGIVELLKFLLDDPQTKVIGLYIEDAAPGRQLFELLRSKRATKPVVILKGGRTAQGQQAAASHTGALAGDLRGWQALEAQTQSVLVSTVDQFLDVLHALEHLSLRPGLELSEVVLFGNGGGTSVLSTDYLAGLGLSVTSFDTALRTQLDALEVPPGTSLANPIDTPVATLQQENGFIAKKIIDIVFGTRAIATTAQAMIVHLNLASFVGRGPVDPLENLLAVLQQAQLDYGAQVHLLLALRSDGSASLDQSQRDYAARAIERRIPVYREVENAADALAAIARLQRTARNFD